MFLTAITQDTGLDEDFLLAKTYLAHVMWTEVFGRIRIYKKVLADATLESFTETRKQIGNLVCPAGRVTDVGLEDETSCGHVERGDVTGHGSAVPVKERRPLNQKKY